MCVWGGGGGHCLIRSHFEHPRKNWINPFKTNSGIFHKAKFNKVRMVHCTYRGLKFPGNIVFFSLKINYLLTNSANLDEMQSNAAFHLGSHCLP